MLDQKKTSVYVRKLSQLVKCADYTFLCEKYTETSRKTVSFKKMRVKKEIIFPLKWIVTEIHICMDFMLCSIIIWLDWNGMHSLYHEKLAWNIHKTCTDSHLRKKIHANKKFSSQLKIKKASTRNPSAANVCNSNENSVGCKLKLYENKSTFENSEMFSNFVDGFFFFFGVVVIIVVCLLRSIASGCFIREKKSFRVKL